MYVAHIQTITAQAPKKITIIPVRPVPAAYEGIGRSTIARTLSPVCLYPGALHASAHSYNSIELASPVSVYMNTVPLCALRLCQRLGGFCWCSQVPCRTSSTGNSARASQRHGQHTSPAAYIAQTHRCWYALDTVSCGISHAKVDNKLQMLRCPNRHGTLCTSHQVVTKAKCLHAVQRPMRPSPLCTSAVLIARRPTGPKFNMESVRTHALQHGAQFHTHAAHNCKAQPRPQCLANACTAQREAYELGMHQCSTTCPPSRLCPKSCLHADYRRSCHSSRFIATPAAHDHSRVQFCPSTPVIAAPLCPGSVACRHNHVRLANQSPVGRPPRPAMYGSFVHKKG